MYIQLYIHVHVLMYIHVHVLYLKAIHIANFMLVVPIPAIPTLPADNAPKEARLGSYKNTQQ